MNLDLNRTRDLPPAVRLALFGCVAAAILVATYFAMQPAGEPETKPKASTPSVAPIVVPTEGAPENADTVDEDTTEGVEIDVTPPVGKEELNDAAATAIEFSELFVSYRYDTNLARKVRRLEDLMSERSLVDLTSLSASNLAETSLKKSRIVVDAKAVAVTTTLVAPSTVMFDVAIETTTHSEGKNTEAAEQTQHYNVTLYRADASQAWEIENFTPEGFDQHTHDEE